MRIMFDLSDADLNHFRGVMRRAIKAHKDTDDGTIISSSDNSLYVERATGKFGGGLQIAEAATDGMRVRRAPGR